MPARASPCVDRALFVGRFQPFHVGHLEVCRRVAPLHDRLVVGIGSAQESHTLANPFTAGERHELIDAALEDAGVANRAIVPIPDLNRNALWVSHVESLVPRFRVVYTNNPLPRELFRARGYEVRPAPFHDRATFEGTRLRRLMLDGGEWEPLVPKAVATAIHSIRGVERLRLLAASDSTPEGA
jgi:nicotinamide-nucleotide adenylyltransferase